MIIPEKYKDKYLGMRESMRMNIRQFGMSADFLFAKPSTAIDYSHSVRYYFFEGDFDRFNALMSEFEIKFPGSPDLALAACVIFQFTGKSEQALEQIDKALEKYPTNLDYALIKADLLFDLQKNREALRFLEPFESANPNSYHLLLFLAMLTQTLGEYPQSLDYAARARQCPDYDSKIEKYLTRQIAYSHELSGNAKNAVAILQKYCDGKSFDKELKYQIMFAAQESGDYALMTKSATEILRKEKSDNDALFFRGFGYYISGKYKKGMKDGDTLVRLYPDSQDGYVIRIMNMDGLGYSKEKMQDDIKMLEKLKGRNPQDLLESLKAMLKI